MLHLLSDENFDGHIVRGPTRRMPDIDLLRVQDVGLANTDDPSILDWAARRGRILLTHDRRTVPSFALDRVARAKLMPGVFIVDDQMSVAQAIEELLLAVQCSDEAEWNNLVAYFPL